MMYKGKALEKLQRKESWGEAILGGIMFVILMALIVFFFAVMQGGRYGY